MILGSSSKTTTTHLPQTAARELALKTLEHYTDVQAQAQAQPGTKPHTQTREPTKHISPKPEAEERGKRKQSTRGGIGAFFTALFKRQSSVRG